jgi:hypothetical protein
MNPERTAHLIPFKNNRLAHVASPQNEGARDRGLLLGRYSRLHLVTAESLRTYEAPEEDMSSLRSMWLRCKRALGLGRFYPVLHG